MEIKKWNKEKKERSKSKEKMMTIIIVDDAKTR